MKCFYHNDLDGRGAASIVVQATLNYSKEDYFEVDYVMELPLDLIKEGEQVWFVDYSFKKDTCHILTDLITKNCEVIWIDHHTSSINLEKEFPEFLKIKGLRQEGISGAALVYMYYYNCNFDKVPYYIKLISDYDCWQYKYDPDTTFFKLGIGGTEHHPLNDIWNALLEDKEGKQLSTLIATGKSIKNYIDIENTFYREHFSYESEIAGYKCLVVNKKTNSWVFGEKYKEYPLVVVWVFDGSKYAYSIFTSNKDIDCCKIAESYGGGGHKGAAGFNSTELLFKKV